MKNLINKLASVSLVVTLSFSLGFFHDLFPSDKSVKSTEQRVAHPTKPRP